MEKKRLRSTNIKIAVVYLSSLVLAQALGILLLLRNPSLTSILLLGLGVLALPIVLGLVLVSVVKHKYGQTTTKK